MDPQNSLKRPSEDSENAQSPSKQVKLDGPDYQDLVLKVQSLERENKAQSNTISAMNNKLDKIVRLLSDLTEKEATMSKNVSNLNKLLEKQAEKSKPNASKSMGVFLQNLQKDESKNQSNGHNKEDKAPIDNKPIVRQPVDELDELKWAKDSYFIGDGLIGRLEKVPDIKEKLDKMKKELNLRLKSKDKERVCYLYDRSRKQLKAPVHSTVKKVVLSIGSQDLFTDPLLTLKQASKQEVKEANESKLKERATHIKALIQALMGKNMEKKVVYIIPTTCIERKEVFEHFEEIITETLKDLPFPNFKLINFPELIRETPEPLNTWFDDLKNGILSEYGCRRLFESIKRTVWSNSRQANLLTRKDVDVQILGPDDNANPCPRCTKLHPGGPDNCKSKNKGCRRCGLAGHYVDVHDVEDPEFKKLIVQTIGVDIYGDTDMTGIENGQEPLMAMPNQLNPNTLSDWYAA